MKAANDWEANVNGGDAASNAKDYSKARAFFESALQEAQRRWPGGGRVALSLVHLAQFYRDQNQVPVALVLYQQAAQIYQKNPAVAAPYENDHRPAGVDWARVVENIAALYEKESRFDKAEQTYKQAIAIDEKFLGPDSLDEAYITNQLATLYENQSRLDESETLYRRVVAIAEKNGEEGMDRLADGLTGLAAVDMYRDKNSDAKQSLLHAYKIETSAPARDDQLKANTLTVLGLVYASEGQEQEAVLVYKKALLLQKEAGGLEHPGIATLLIALAGIYMDRGKDLEAEVLLKRSLAIRGKVFGANGTSAAAVMSMLSLLYGYEARYNLAESTAKQALAIQQAKLRPNDPDIAFTENRLALAYEGEGRLAEAEHLFETALAIRIQNYGPESTNNVVIMENLARVDYKEGKKTPAWKLYHDAEKIRRSNPMAQETH